MTDQNNPENNGTLRLFKFGKKIFDKLNEAMNPQFADEDPVNPFCLWTGAALKLKIRNVEGYRNYDKSEFATPGPLFEDDSKMETIWKQEHSLQTFIDQSNFKSYEELSKRLAVVLGNDKLGANRTPMKIKIFHGLSQRRNVKFKRRLFRLRLKMKMRISSSSNHLLRTKT